MGLFVKILIYFFLFAGVLGVYQISWLPCKFTDERVFLNDLGLVETQHIPREAMLQFGLKGDAPVNPYAVTFLITSSKLELRRFVEGVDMDQLTCELQRYSTEGLHVRWPVKGEHEYNRWFTCTLKHSKGLFTVLSFIRQSTNQPPTGERDYRNWTAIEDREVLTSSVTMVMKTQSPSIKASLGSQQKLHCQFAIDHKAANVAVEWHRRGERTTLFSHSSQSGSTQGSGVAVKKLAAGDATYTIPFTKMGSEGTYICSVSVQPLLGSQEISLQIEESPRVSLNVGPTLTLSEGAEQKVVCEADGYYPLDVDIQWSHQDAADVGRRVGAPLPKVLDNILLSSHKHNSDRTLTLSAFFYLEAQLSHSGRQFTCSVSHQSLRVPIKKSFTLIVQEPTQWMFILTAATLLVVLVFLLHYLHRRRVRRHHFW